MVSPYARTLAQVVDDTLRFVNDFKGTGQDGYLWKWNEVKARANDLVIDLVRRTGLLRHTDKITLEEDVNVYDLPVDCIRPLHLMLDGVDGTLVLPRSLNELDFQGQPIAISGDPYYVYRDVLLPTQIGFFPTPSSDGSATDYSGNILVVYVRAPLMWDNPDSYPDPEIPDWCHKDFKYGLAEMILPTSNKPLHISKLVRAKKKWMRTVYQVQRICEFAGPLTGMEPV